MTGQTPIHKLPYPTAGDPVYKGAEQMEALARAVDTKLSGGSGGASGSVTATPGTLVQRDDAGRTQVTDPAEDADAANLGWIVSQNFATETYVDEKIQGLDLGGDHDGGTTPTPPTPAPDTTPKSVTATGGSLALRDEKGRTQVGAPSSAADATPKSYVDTNITNKGYITSAALDDYATKTFVNDAVSKGGSSGADTAALDAIRTGLFGGPKRTVAPVAEIAVRQDHDIYGGTDQLAAGNWTVKVDTDKGATVSATFGKTSYTVPIDGRYEITYQLFHKADNATHGGAMKVLVNGTDVLRYSVASETATPSLEGPTMNMKTEHVCSKGDVIRWGYWYAGTVRLLRFGFGSAESKIMIRWVGPV